MKNKKININKSPSSQATSGWARPGWARPDSFKFFIYTLRQPQPPAKYIGFSERSKEHYCRTLKINILTAGLGYCRMNLSMTILIDKILA